jgi:tetratricopeptide (TPR) repeat protein
MKRGRIPASAWLAPIGAAAIVAPAAAAPLNVSIVEQGDGARLALRWDDGRITAPVAEAGVNGQVAIVRFAEPFEADVSALAAAAPNELAAASVDPDGRTLRLTLKRPLLPRASSSGEVLIVSLTPPAPTKTKTPVEADAEDAVLTIGQRDDFTRLSFLFQHGATALPFRKGNVLDLKFSKAVDVDISQIHILPPKFVKDAEKVNKPGQALVVRLTLEPDVQIRSFVEGPRVLVDVLAPDPKILAARKAAPPPPPPPKPADADPAPATGVVRLQMSETPEATTFTTRWARPARVAAFRRGEAIWILFDSHARIDLAGLARVGRRHQDIQKVTGDGVTGVRIPATPDTLVTAKAEGATWTFTLADHADALEAPAAVTRTAGPDGAQRLSVDFGREGVVRWVEDPAVGDKFAAALLNGPVKGVDTRRATLEAAVLPAAQGAVIEPRADGVGAAFENNKLIVTRGAGLIASAAPPPPAQGAPAPVAAASAPAPASDVLLDLAAWGGGSKQRAIEVLDGLERTAAQEGVGEGARADARMALAKFLLANELASEALGALRVAAVNQPLLDSDPRFKLMRAAASLMLGRVRDAQVDLSAGVLADDPSAALWRGYAAALSENWAEARRSFQDGQGALLTQPQNWRARFNLALAESALELKDLAAADDALAQAIGEASTEDVRASCQILKARLMAARGDAKGGLALLAAVEASRDEGAAVRATLEATRLGRETGAISPETAIETLEALRFRWRGDGLELETIQTLGHVYEDTGRWREALSVMHAAAARFPDLPASRRMRIDMADAFERLFLEGEADKLEPIQALGLFYEFKDLTPIGPNGDRMIRLLSARLVSVDLLEKASELLQYQVDNRLEGVGQAQVAADLAAIYVADRQPEKALMAIETTRQPGVPAGIAATRRIVEARALLDLGRFDHALELLEKDQSVDAARVRAEAAWRQKKWPEAVAAISAVLARGPRPGDDLTPEDRAFVLRAAIASVLTGDEATIAKLRATYAKRMAASPDADAFDLVTSGVDPGDVRLREVARQIARTDLIDRVMNEIKGRLKEAPPPAPRAAGA